MRCDKHCIAAFFMPTKNYSFSDHFSAFFWLESKETLWFLSFWCYYSTQWLHFCYIFAFFVVKMKSFFWKLQFYATAQCLLLYKTTSPYYNQNNNLPKKHRICSPLQNGFSFFQRHRQPTFLSTGGRRIFFFWPGRWILDAAPRT